ncbi:MULTISPECIES: aminopeptidase P family protein [Planktothricoides]|uniref:Xaa-Pro aminopeptidase n=2 Tax=Planktothricoides raciborskii TaxID=132608 RepID=A0AAU8JKV6_9CYAN|nr:MULTISPECIES: aminopeptidase P family protein [Planktothricoides]KOR33789.1 aminopeptidase [Planktothricoides sp. SR001]MBD2547839.1 aminopeptidase P family protein [Planktothricoides raciborskii FACHB-1370]MBD2586275.1 aminopeptidase P family protein [Planktothricoides raciborskii FACHB-1261]
MPATSPNPIVETLKNRRQQLAQLISFPVILWSGKPSSRNFPHNTFPFRPSSHFLYFAGLPVEDAAIRLDSGKLELFMDDPNPESTLWHGVMPTRAQIAEAIGADAAFPKQELASRATGAATIMVQDSATRAEQYMVRNMVRHSVQPKCSAPLPRTDDRYDDRYKEIDLQLAQAIATVRLTHDQIALSQLMSAAACTMQAHLAGMMATPRAKTEAMVRAAMEGVLIANNMQCAYNSIVTVHGEVLHNQVYHHPLQPGDLLLVDLGAETASGWAADVTRTWPVSGKFSPTQRDIYDIVLAAHDACIAYARPGVEYQDIHLLACRVIAEGLVNLGILKGQPEDLVEMDAHALFFPHGIGHLLGLDVHDMEDLGDIAGYETGRVRSDRFGLCFLRLNRPLRAGMLVTIEPGFYQVPAILNQPENRNKYKDVVNWEYLAKFADVRGIRIEDDVLITDGRSETLTADLPTNPHIIEQIIQG